MNEETKDLAVIVRDAQLPESKAQQLLANFSGYFALAADWEQKARAIRVTDETQVAEMKMAREGRLFLKAKRVELEKTRKTLKEDVVREGKAIDGIANVLKAVIEPIEEYLDQQEHFVEYKRQAEEEARRQEAERVLREKEEADRLAREEEQRRIKAENERLIKEAEEREAAMIKAQKAAEAKLQAERKKAEAARAAIEEAARKEREAALAEERRKAAEEVARIKKEAQAKAAKERKEMEARIAEERRLAHLVTCPKCGHEFSTEEEGSCGGQ